MSSGVKVNPDCLTAFNEFKIGKKDKKEFAFIVFGFNKAATEIVVLHSEKKIAGDDTLKAKNSQWETLISMLPNDDVRYAVADVHYKIPEGERTNMVFITWAPETAHIKRRMLMASSSETLKQSLVGINTTIQATCYPDLELRSVVEKFKGSIDYQ